MRRSQLIAVFSAILLFGCGVALGIVGQRYYDQTEVSAKTSDDWRVQYMAEMRTRAHLSDRQLQKLNVILDQTKQEYRDMRERHKPEVLEIKVNQIARVKSILTAEQIPLYDQLIAEREQRQKEQDDRDRADEMKRAAQAAAAAKD
jgi:hypothetical protein